MDVAVVMVDAARPYAQSDFEGAMRWAVTHAAAVWNPMADRGQMAAVAQHVESAVLTGT